MDIESTRGLKRTSIYLRPGFDLDALEADFDNHSIRRREICKKLKISESTLTKVVREQRWAWRSPKPINRHDIIDRMFRLLDSQIEELEINVTKSGTAEVTALSRLVTSLGRLIEIKEAEDSKRRPRETRKMSAIKQRLVERIEQLKRA